MKDRIKEIADAHRVKVGFIGGALVVSSAFGTCQYTPELAPSGDEVAPEAPAEPEADEAPKEEPVEAEEADDAKDAE